MHTRISAIFNKKISYYKIIPLHNYGHMLILQYAKTMCGAAAELPLDQKHT